MTQLRHAAKRVRALREALKYSKAELARKAMLTPSQYAWFEPGGKNYHPRVCQVPTPWADRLAVALGTTVDYIATGKIDAQPVPPNHPLRPMLIAFEKERAKYERNARRQERNRVKLEQLVESTANELKVTKQMAEAALQMRADDAAYLDVVIKSFMGADTTNNAIAQEELRAAVDRMLAGESARGPEPDYEIIERDDPRWRGPGQPEHGEDLQAQREQADEQHANNPRKRQGHKCRNGHAATVNGECENSECQYYIGINVAGHACAWCGYPVYGTGKCTNDECDNYEADEGPDPTRMADVRVQEAQSLARRR
jgi:transcriptional regulator with XRE-family HTH domain